MLTNIFLQAATASLGGSAATSTSTGGGVTTTVTTTAYATVGADGSVSGSRSDSNTGVEAGIGAGVGIPLLLAFLGTLGLYLRERRLRKQLGLNVPAQSGSGAAGYANGTGAVQYDALRPDGGGFQEQKTTAWQSSGGYQGTVQELGINERRVEMQ